MKSYTDLEQSKKLAEILPTKSADMYYISGDECDICFGRGVYEEIADWICEGMSKPADVPCWSLAALLNVLPDELKDNDFLTLQKEKNEYCCCYEDINGNGFRHTFADNPVDACVAMIEKLQELNLL